MARNKPTRTAREAKAIADQAVALAEYAATALVAAEQLGIKAKAVEAFPLSEEERATAAHLPALAAKLKKKLVKKDDSFTVAEVASIVMAMAGSFVDAEAKQQVALLVVAKKLMECLQANFARSNLRPAKTTKGTKATPAEAAYQFKITLLALVLFAGRRFDLAMLAWRQSINFFATTSMATCCFGSASTKESATARTMPPTSATVKEPSFFTSFFLSLAARAGRCATVVRSSSVNGYSSTAFALMPSCSAATSAVPAYSASAAA